MRRILSKQISTPDSHTNKTVCRLRHTLYFRNSWMTKIRLKEGRGMDMGLQLLDICSELWVFGTRISEGMKAEIEKAKIKGISIRYFSESMEEG